MHGDGLYRLWCVLNRIVLEFVFGHGGLRCIVETYR